MLLMLSSGIAFSHCCRGPFHAGAMLVLAFCGLSALVHIAFELVLGTGWGWDSEAAYGVLKEAALIAMIAGVVLLLFRNRAGRGALVFLMAGLALFLGSWSFRVNPNTELWEMLLYPLKWRSFNANTCIRIVACEIVLSVVLVAGAIPRFTDVLLRGARARE